MTLKLVYILVIIVIINVSSANVCFYNIICRKVVIQLVLKFSPPSNRARAMKIRGASAFALPSVL